MDYKMEEVMPLVAKLCDKYTSKESSSVTYETARVLMEAVIYSINEFYSLSEQDELSTQEQLPCDLSYQLGSEKVIEKVKRAKEIYDGVIAHFTDYGCKNYSDTILKGIPEFFLRYDAKFQPQNHLLTLDYPTMYMNFNSCGIDLIYEYLTGIALEKRLLDLFHQDSIRNLLHYFSSKNGFEYLDNICYLVLLQAIGCFIADRSVSDLLLYDTDIEELEFYFSNHSLLQIQEKIEGIIKILCNALGANDLNPSFATDILYLTKIKSDIAIRIDNGVRNHCLSNVFVIL